MRILALFVTLALIFFTSLNARVHQESLKQGERHVVELHGNLEVEKDAIYEAIGVNLPNPLMFWRKSEVTIDSEKLEGLQQRFKRFYEEEGFYEASIEVKRESKKVMIKIDALKPVRIKEIEIQSDVNLDPLVTFKKNERFRAKKFIETKERIIDMLLKKGFCSHEVDTKAYVDLETKGVTLRFKVKKGEPCYFGNTTLKGNQEIDKQIILSRLAYKESERFDPKKIETTHEAIYKLGAFDTLKIDVSRKVFNVIPVDIEVGEVQKPYHLELGAGYDTFVGARIQGSLTHRNFLGNAKRAGIAFAYSDKEYYVKVNFFKPALFEVDGYWFDYGLLVGYSDLLFSGFQELKRFMRHYAEHSRNDILLRAGVGYEEIGISEAQVVEGDPIEQAIREGDFLLVYPFFDVVFDKRDDRLNPKSGYYLKGSLEYGLSHKDKSSRFMKLILQGHYIKGFDRLTAAAVAKVGVVDQKEFRLPESKLFFAGGAFSNRAYREQSLGVIVSKKEDSFYGASSWLNLTLEASYPIAKRFEMALFSDMTMLNAEPYDFSGEVITAAGVGVRYLTPVGPFKVDVGFNVYDPKQYGIIFQLGQTF